MDKIIKMWVNTHTQKDGNKYYTAHVRRRWLIFPYTQFIAKWDHECFFTASEYFRPHQFETKEGAINSLENIKDGEDKRNLRERNKAVVSTEKEYVIVNKEGS